MKNVARVVYGLRAVGWRASRGWNWTMAAILVCGAMATTMGAAEAQSTNALPAAPRKPSIIFILADDLGYGVVGCYGQSRIKTPNIDKLASEGLRFTSFYAGSTVCAPSRCALMTGLHSGRGVVRGNGK